MSWVVQSEEQAGQIGAGEGDEVLYAVTVWDLLIAYENEKGEGSWAKLTEDEKRSLIHRARRYMEGFCGEGSYNFADALRDAVQDEELDEPVQRGA